MVVLLLTEDERIPVVDACGSPDWHAYTSPEELLPPGPVYQVPLRRGVKLLYTTNANANVNATASALAGHTVKGEACLVCGSPPSASEQGPNTPTGANFSPLLSTSPPTAPSAAAADQLLAELLAGRKLLASGPTTPRPGARDQAAPAASTPTPATSAPLDVPLRAVGGAAMGEQQQQQRDIVREGSPPQAPAAVHGTIRAILQSRNAPMTHHQCEQCKQQHAHPHPHHHQQYQQHPQVPHRPPAWSSASGCTSPASRSSLDLDHMHQHHQHQQCRRSTGGGGGSASAADCSNQQQPASPGRRRSPLSACRTEPSGCAAGQPAHAATGAQAAPGHRLRVAHTASDTAPDHATSGATALGPPTHAPPAAPPSPTSTAEDDTVSPTGAATALPAASTAPVSGAEEPPSGGPVHWSELPQDVVASVALALPRRASRGLLAMAATCRAWREVLLGHVPVLLHVAFGLDPAQPLRPLGAEEEGYGPAAGAADVGSGSEGYGGGSRGGGSWRGGRGAAAGGELGDGEAAGADGRDPGGGGASRRGKEGGDDGDQDGGYSYDEQAGRLRQYAAGAFLLPNPGHHPQQQEQDADTEPHGGLGLRVSSLPLPPLQLQQQVAVPRLLLEAARASNASAQLVMAQLLEAWGDGGGAMRWWRRLAKAGDTMAAFKMGMAHYDGAHGVAYDTDTAHMWLGRVVRGVLRVEGLGVLPLEGGAERRAGARAAAAAAAAAPAAAPPGRNGGAALGPEEGGGTGAAPQRTHAALLQQLRSLPGPLLRMLGCAALLLAYLEFDGLAGRAAWGLGDRAEAVRAFRLAELCGVEEASTSLGWIYNTGQFG